MNRGRAPVLEFDKAYLQDLLDDSNWSRDDLLRHMWEVGWTGSKASVDQMLHPRRVRQVKGDTLLCLAMVFQVHPAEFYRWSDGVSLRIDRPPRRPLAR